MNIYPVRYRQIDKSNLKIGMTCYFKLIGINNVYPYNFCFVMVKILSFLGQEIVEFTLVAGDDFKYQTSDLENFHESYV